MDMDGVAFVVLFAGAIVETVLYFFASPLLARLAFVPLGTVTIDVGPSGQEILSGRKAAALAAEGMPREASGYREAPAAPTAKLQSVVETLGIAPSEDAETHLVYSTPLRDEIAVRLPFKVFGMRSYGLTNTKLSFDGHRVVARTRFLPVPAVSYALAAVFFFIGGLVDAQGAGALFFPAALFAALVVNGVISYFRLRGPMLTTRLRIENGLASLR